MSEFFNTRLGVAVEFIKNGTTATQLKIKSSKAVTRIETIAEGEVNLDKVGFVGDAEDIERYKLITGDILFSHINSIKHIGKTAIIRGSEEIYNGMNLLQIRPNTRETDPSFLHELLRSDNFRAEVRRSAKQAVNQASISIAQLQELEICLPPLPEQKKIAEILSGVDDEIDAIKNLISLLTLAKRNLLQDTAEKEQSKFSVKALGEIASVINGYAFSSGDLEDASDGIPVIRMSNLKSGAVQYESALKIQENKASELERFLLRKGDLLIGMSGSISNTALVTSDRKALLNQRVGALRAKNEGSSYHAIAYQSEIVMRQVEQMAAGGAQLNISSSQIESVEIPIPSQSNMEKITQCWFSIENLIHLNKSKLGKMCSLKSAMSSDLLSGRKRVSI
jgi:type I restriction enzyme S subunit